MKKNIILLFFVSFSLSGFAQLTIENGANIVVSASSTLVANYGIISNSGLIDNDGTIINHGNLVTNTSGLFSATSTGTIKFNGITVQEITGDHDAAFYGSVEIDNSAGVSITNTAVGASQTMNGSLVFTNGLLILNGFNLTLLADVTTPGIDKYVQTNSTGAVTRNVPADGATNVFFPVGNSAYNPITLQNSATSTADDYSVRAVDAEPAGGSTDHFVDRSWVITELVGGGSDLTVTPQWNGAEELTSFDRTNSSVGLTTDAGVTYQWSTTAAASGTDPYSVSGSPFTGVGTFTVGDYFYSGFNINLKFFLGGAYNGTSMTQLLNTQNLIPLADPYSLGTTVTSIPANAVDWVVVKLRDKNNSSSILHQFAFFVDPSGNLLNTDGSTGGSLTGVVKDNYFIEVNHRNHNGVMTIATVDLTAVSPTFDYSLNTGVYGTNPMVDLGSGIYGLRKGNVNNDGRISKVGPISINDYTALLNTLGTNNFILSTYSNADVNMDGNIRKVGPTSINDYTALLNSLGTSTFIMQQLP